MEKKLSDIGEIILGHTFRGAITNDPSGNYAILQAKNIKGEGVVDSTDLSRALITRKTRAVLEHRDVALSNRGTFRAGIYIGNEPNVLAASSVYIIRIHDQDLILPEYLAIFLNSHIGQLQLQAMNRGTLIKSLPKRSLAELPIPIPEASIQQTIINVHRNFHERAALYRRHAHLSAAIANQTISLLIS